MKEKLEKIKEEFKNGGLLDLTTDGVVSWENDVQWLINNLEMMILKDEERDYREEMDAYEYRNEQELREMYND